MQVSRVYECEPIDVTEWQPRFLNAALVGTTARSAPDLLDRLLTIEAYAGRTRPHQGAARTLDLDLILYGDVVSESPTVLVPHPRFRDRLFVLEPLAEVAGDWVDPVTGLTVQRLLVNARAQIVTDPKRRPWLAGTR